MSGAQHMAQQVRPRDVLGILATGWGEAAWYLKPGIVLLAPVVVGLAAAVWWAAICDRLAERFGQYREWLAARAPRGALAAPGGDPE